MSVRMTSAVWESGPGTQTALLVLLALADYADDAGRCFPSVSTVAQRARTTDRHVRRVLADLEDQGWIRREERSGRSTLFRVTPDTGVTPDPQVSPDPQVRTPDPQVTPPLTPRSGTPDPQVTHNHQEPSEEPPQNRQSTREPRGTRIPEPFPVTPEMVAWARDQVPGLDHKAITESFVDYWRAQPGAKGRKTDWVATWRNWLRNEQKRSPHARTRPGQSTGTNRAMQTLELARLYAEQEAQEGAQRAEITDGRAAG